MSSRFRPAVSWQQEWLQDMPNWPCGSVFSAGAELVRAGWLGQRPGRTRSAWADAGGVLDAGAHERPAGKGPCCLGGSRVRGCGRPRPNVRPSRPLAAFIFRLSPERPAAGGWAGYAAGADGAIQTGTRAAGPDGQGRRPRRGQSIRRPRAL
jgi:hypothetical protein